MPAATAYGDDTPSPGALRPAPAQPDGPGAPGAPEDPAVLDAAQNAALASLIRRLADSRPEIVAGRPPTAIPPQPGEPRPRAHEPRPGAPDRTAPRPGPGPDARHHRTPTPDPAPLHCPHGYSRAHTAHPDHEARPAEPPSSPRHRRASRGAVWGRPLRELGATVGAAAVAAGTAAALVRVLPVLAP